MKLSHLLRAGALAVSLAAGLLPARADFGASGPGGTFTLCGKTSNGIQIPCHIWVDSTNTPVGTAANPLFMQIGAGSAAIGSVTVSALPALVAGTATIGSIANISGTISLPTGASTAAAQANQLAQETATAAALGTIADSAYAGSGSASNVAALKGIYAQIASVLAQVTSANTANGAPTDIAYAGTGSASEIAALKGLYSQIGNLLTANGGVADTAYAGTGSASQIAALKGLYAQLSSLLVANGTSADAAYAGSGNASQVAALKGIYAQLVTIAGQAAPVSLPGVSIASSVSVPGFQGVLNGVPVGVSLTSLPAFASTPAFNLTQIAGAALSAANPLPTQLSVAGAAATMANPVPVANSVNGAAVSSSNPLPVDTVVRTTATSRSTILPVQENTAAVAAGGTGNVVGDVLTFAGGSSTVPVSATQATPGKCTVTAVTSGAVTACAPLAGSLGSYTALPANPVTTTSSGSGTGATLNLTYTGLSVQIAAANAVRRALHVQPQGGIAYMSGLSAATADFNAMKLPADSLYTTDPQVVGTGAINVITAGTVPLPLYAREF